MLQLRNTPDPDCSFSSAQIVFGHPLRDAFLFVNRLEKYLNPAVRPAWRNAWEAKEQALKTQMAHFIESLGTHSRVLHPLAVGEKVFRCEEHLYKRLCPSVGRLVRPPRCNYVEN
jgi:maltooligosyltrehalose synthase